MRQRILLIVLAVALCVALACCMRWRSRAQSRPVITIQDGKTIDFSSGKPVVKDTAQEKALIDAAVKEMDAAAKSVKFGPTVPPPPKPKPAEPPPAQPPGG